MPKKYLKEACVETLEQALNAEEQGADRLELCSCLEFDGLTPPLSLVEAVLDSVKIPIRVMIRPRKGDFKYTEEEIDQMKSCIWDYKGTGIEGVVFGVLNDDRTLNIAAISQLTEAAKPLKVVFHKAIDSTPDIEEALLKLLEIKGVDTVLTSGGKSNAFDGSETLKQLLKLAKNKIEIMPAGKITQFNLTELDQLIGAKAYHGKLIVGVL